MLSIYIHIPFCVKKCFYCDFLSFSSDREEKEAYIQALLEEIKREAPRYKSHLVDTVFFGGGTPSLLDGGQIVGIMEALKRCYHFATTPEVTIEVNPGTVDKEKLLAYQKAGINRLSIGTQSLQEEELQLLGRIHGVSDFYRTFYMAREVGFDNINIDLMSALPGQKIESYRDSLDKVIELQPEHISAYSLIIEEGTPFFDRYGIDAKQKEMLPSEEEERLMYEETGRLLDEAGYWRYEISNYARAGRECRHNIAYWKRENYVGFGLGSASMVDNVRWKNTSDISKYMAMFSGQAADDVSGDRSDIREEIQYLSMEEQMEEFMFLGLRLTGGVSRAVFLKLFQKNIEDVYGDVLTKLRKQGLIKSFEQITLTPFGRDVSNYVLAQFLL